MHLNGKHLNTASFIISSPDVYINKRITNNKPGMLLIYADWCGHCQRFKPIFNQIHSKIGSSFICASVSDEVLKTNPKLMDSLNFRGFPTIKFFDQNGKFIEDYNGNRESSDILDYICKFYHKCY